MIFVGGEIEGGEGGEEGEEGVGEKAKSSSRRQRLLI